MDIKEKKLKFLIYQKKREKKTQQAVRESLTKIRQKKRKNV